MRSCEGKSIVRIKKERRPNWSPLFLFDFDGLRKGAKSLTPDAQGPVVVYVPDASGAVMFILKCNELPTSQRHGKLT